MTTLVEAFKKIEASLSEVGISATPPDTRAQESLALPEGVKLISQRVDSKGMKVQIYTCDSMEPLVNYEKARREACPGIMFRVRHFRTESGHAVSFRFDGKK